MYTDKEIEKIMKETFSRRFRVLVDRCEDISKLEINDSTIKKYKSGERFPILPNFKKIKEFFNTSYDYLLGEPCNTSVIDVESNYGLDEETLNILNEIKINSKISNKETIVEDTITLQAINLIIKDNIFLKALFYKLFIAIKQNEISNDEIKKKHELLRISEKIDSIFDDTFKNLDLNIIPNEIVNYISSIKMPKELNRMREFIDNVKQR